MDILYLINRLENLVTSSPKMPFTNQLLIKEHDMLALLDQMRASIPDEVKQARRLVQEKERILAQAQTEASELLAQARAEAERTLGREGLMRIAEERSQEVLRQANERARQMVLQAEDRTEALKAEADAYVAETLHNLKEHLSSIESEVSRTILSIEKGLESLKTPPHQSEEFEVYEELDDLDAAHEGEFEVYEDDLDRKAEEEEEPPQLHPVPRRSSLATDTTGGP
jgi:F0F1-type ATP synthase membrane subunit b/b'